MATRGAHQLLSAIVALSACVGALNIIFPPPTTVRSPLITILRSTSYVALRTVGTVLSYFGVFTSTFPGPIGFFLGPIGVWFPTNFTSSPHTLVLVVTVFSSTSSPYITCTILNTPTIGLYLSHVIRYSP